jgi:hypothetical protein
MRSEKWKKQKKHTRELWDYSKETMNMDILNKKSADLGVRDQINQKFAKELIRFQEDKVAILQHEEELPEDMDQPIPQNLVNMEKNALGRLFNPFLELKGLFSLSYLKQHSTSDFCHVVFVYFFRF